MSRHYALTNLPRIDLSPQPPPEQAPPLQDNSPRIFEHIIRYEKPGLNSSVSSCGLFEIFNLYYATFESINALVQKAPRKIIIATTIPSQVDGIKALRANGFQEVTSIKNGSGNLVTLWFLKTE